MKSHKLLGILFFVALTCIGFASCSSDDKKDEPSQGAKSAIVGTWQLFKVETINKDNGEVISKDVEIITDEAEGFVRIFNEDKTWENWSESNSGRWILNESGKWKLNSGKLELTYFGGLTKKEVVLINSITPEQLTMQFEDEWVGGYYVGKDWHDETRTKIETYKKNDALGL